ncbi:MAG: hypothetical protein ACLR8P_18005 [Clostridium fessum]
MKEPVRFYHSLNSKVGLLKLIPAMDSGVLDYMAEHCDAVILESFGVGGIPTYDSRSIFINPLKIWCGPEKQLS